MPEACGGHRQNLPQTKVSSNRTFNRTNERKCLIHEGVSKVCKTLIRRFDPDPRLQRFQYKPIEVCDLWAESRLRWFVPRERQVLSVATATPVSCDTSATDSSAGASVVLRSVLAWIPRQGVPVFITVPQRLGVVDAESVKRCALGDLGHTGALLRLSRLHVSSGVEHDAVHLSR